MTLYPCVQPVIWHKHRSYSSSVDLLNNKVKTFDDPVTIQVFAWYLGRSTEPNVNGHAERVVSDATCFPKAAQGVTAYDRIELPGAGLYEVNGEPSNWDNNPWFSPGLVQCNLRKVDG